WRPFGDRTVVRGGYGVFYEAEGTSGRLNFNFIPFSLAESVTATVNAVPTRTCADFYLGVPFGASVGTVNWSPLPFEARMGYDQRWNTGIQQEVFNRTALDVNYVGTRGSNQQQAEPINLPPAGPGSVQARRPSPRAGSGTVSTQAPTSQCHARPAELQSQFTFGNSGSGILRGDHQWNVDASLFKRLTVSSGSTLEFRAEAFNLLNSVYFNAPNTQIDTAAGGRVTSTSNQARQIQLGL